MSSWLELLKNNSGILSNKLPYIAALIDDIEYLSLSIFLNILSNNVFKS